MRTWLARTLLILSATAVAALVGATPAAAGGPTRMALTGPDGIESAVRYDDHPELFNRLFDVGNRLGEASSPLAEAPAVPGRSWTLVADYHDVPTYRYELFPFATGGPHVYVSGKTLRPDTFPSAPEGWYPTIADLPEVVNRMRALSSLAPVAANAAEDAAAVVPVALKQTRPAAPERTRSTAVLPWAIAIAVPVLLGTLFLMRQRRQRG